MYESFRRYQSALIEQFDKLAEEFHFEVIDARAEPQEIFEQLSQAIERLLVVSAKPVQPAAPAVTAVPAAPAVEPAPVGLAVVPDPIPITERSERVAERREKA